MLPRVAALLGHLHEGWDILTGEVLYFCPFQTVRTYARTAARLQGRLPMTSIEFSKISPRFRGRLLRSGLSSATTT